MLYEIKDLYSTTGDTYVIADRIAYQNQFGSTTKNGEHGLYKTQDDLGDSYNFRGAPSNNYVQFGSYVSNSTVNGTTYNEETPMYWRIFQINGNGTIHIIYDGTNTSKNGISHSSNIVNSLFNSNYDG